MSNYLAIATVTATLQRLLQATVQVDVPGARVTTVRPDASGSGTPEVGVNIYLYQVTPNPAWRNADLRTRRPKGELIKHAQAGLDLYYLMMFYGNEVELEPQRLLGSTVRTLVDQPILTPEMIRDTVNNPTFSFLADSNLEQQVERVTIFPAQMNTEELSKIWSVFFQSPYVLSFAFQGGAVLIEGQRTTGRVLPIRSREFYMTPNQPAILQIVSDAGANQPIVADSNLIIRGKQLNAEVSDEKLQELMNPNDPEIRRKPQVRGKPQVKIGEARVTPQQVTEQEIRLELASVPTDEKDLLRAGVQSLQIVHPIVPKRTPVEPQRAVGSNVVPFVLCPTIIDVELRDAEDNGDGFYSAEVSVQVDLTVGREQRVFLFLNERISLGNATLRETRSLNNPAAYIFTAKPREADTNVVVFPVVEVKAGEYLVRVQVDGAESPLTVDTDRESSTFEQYIEPVVRIP